MKHFAILMGMVAVTVAALLTESWIHTKFGIILPWETPEHIHLCGREYEEGGPRTFPDEDTPVTTLRATIFDRPIPLPDVAPTDQGLPYGGCPVQVILHLSNRDVVYGFVQGGP